MVMMIVANAQPSRSCSTGTLRSTSVMVMVRMAPSLWTGTSGVRARGGMRLLGGRHGCGSTSAGLAAAVGAAEPRQVVDGEGPFPAQVAGEGEPPAEYRSDAVAVSGEEADVDEQPHPPVLEAAEVQPDGVYHGTPPGDVGGRAQVAVAERLVEALSPGLVGD